jgi:hypothetical protein
MNDARLYGRRRIVEFVREALRRQGVPDRPLPIVLAVGPRGSGGSVLLSRLWEEFSADCLSVRLDLEKAQGVEDVVLAAMHGLSRKISGIRPIEFPRLAMTFKALSYVDDGGGRQAFEGYLRANRRDAEVRSALNDWADRAAPLLNSAGQQVLMTAAARALGGLLSGIGRRGDAKTLRWLANDDRAGGGNEYDPLWDLFGWHHERTEAASRKVGKRLCSAFLADLRSDFNDSSLRHGQRPSNCLLLLDNAGGKVGDLFLELLAECRRESNNAGAAADPAMVVAVQRGRVRRRIGEPIEPTDARLEFGIRHPATGGDDDHPTWWYPVRLTDLSDKDVVEMSKSSVLRSGSRDADFLHTLTGGHPESVDRLAHLLALFGRETFDARQLLSEPLPMSHQLPTHWQLEGADDLTVEDYLLKRTLTDDLTVGPDGGVDTGDNPMLDAMAVLVATPGLRRAACSAALQFLGWTQFGAQAVQDRLAAAMWLDETPDGDADRLHPLIGLLLRRWLARNPDAWRDTHLGYTAHYSRPQDATVRHYHTLALVEPSRPQPLTTVITFLEREYDRLASPEDWLHILDQVTDAPNRLRTTRNPRAFVTTLAGAAAPGSRQRTITRLTVARWLHNDRYFDPAHQLAQVIANEYDYLAELCTADSDALIHQSGRYRRVENNWKD